MNSKIEIPLNKRKITTLLVGSTIFVVLGILFINSPKTFVSPIMRNPEVVRISGIASVAFFGFCLIFIAQKLFDNKRGLIIDQFGITDNTSATNIGLIEWSDITGMEKRQVMSNKFLIIHTNEPEKYIAKAKNVVAKQAMRMNNKTYGSPITIISNSLKIDFDDLESLIKSELEKRKT